MSLKHIFINEKYLFKIEINDAFRRGVADVLCPSSSGNIFCLFCINPDINSPPHIVITESAYANDLHSLVKSMSVFTLSIYKNLSI